MDQNQTTDVSQPSYDFQNQDFNTPKSAKGKILSLIIGIVVVLFIVLLSVFFILPKLRPSAPKDVTLTYWGIWKDNAVMDEVIADFERTHPNIHIQYEKQDIKTLGKYYDRLTTRIKNGTGPDLFRFHNSWALELKNYLLPLPDSVVKATELDTKYFPVVKSDLKMNGAYYGIPIHFDTLALFINKKLLSDPTSYPTTWEDFVKIATAISVPDPTTQKIVTAGAAIGTYDNVAHASDIISLLLAQRNGDLADLGGNKRSITEEVLGFYTALSKDQKLWDDTLDNSRLAFAKGNLAMYFGYSWDIFNFKDPKFNLDFTVVPVPHLAGSNKTIASYWVEGVSAGTKHPKEALEFLQFLAQPSTLEKMYAKESKERLFGELYPRTDMAQLLDSNPLLAPFIDQGPGAVSTPFSSDTYDDAMVDSLNTYLGNSVRSIISNNMSVVSAVDTLGKGVKSVFTQYGQ